MIKILALTITAFFGLNGFCAPLKMAIETEKFPIPPNEKVILSLGNSSKNNLSPSINILVWNLHKGENTNFVHNFKDLALNKDLILSEEVQLNSSMRQLLASFPQLLNVLATSFYLGKDQDPTGVSTSSTVAPLSIDFIKTENLEPITESPKMTLITRYLTHLPNKYLTIVNIHGINFVKNSSYQEEITRIYEAIKDIPSPIIFAGDFNTWNLKRNHILYNICRKLNLSEASFNPDHRTTFNQFPLDHFFHSNDLKIISAQALQNYNGSDHQPLELIVEYIPGVDLAAN